LGRVIDAVRFELYRRVDSPTGNGAAFIERRDQIAVVNGGLASNDKDNGALNGDHTLAANLPRTFTPCSCRS
jgi:hypothetical protein